MTNWRDDIDPTTEAEIDHMVRAAVSAMQQRLLTGGRFDACVVARSSTGRITVCEDTPGEHVNPLAARVQADLGEYSAMAYLIDERDRAEIQIGVEHRAGLAITVIGPYQYLDGNKRVFDKFHSEPADATLWVDALV